MATRPEVQADLFNFIDVDVVLEDRVALHGVSLGIRENGVVVIVGPSGAGKSTLLRLCNRLTAPTAGRVLFRGSDLASLDPLRVRRRVGMIMQRPTPFDGTVADNLHVAVPEATREELTELLAVVDMDSSFLSREAHSLSGGESQRMCLARSLSVSPEVVLMDEPTSSLDEPATRRFERYAARIAEGGTPIIWVTHDLEQAKRIADELVVLIDGSVRAQGTPDIVASIDSEVARFLGGSTSAG